MFLWVYTCAVLHPCLFFLLGASWLESFALAERGPAFHKGLRLVLIRCMYLVTGDCLRCTKEEEDAEGKKKQKKKKQKQKNTVI